MLFLGLVASLSVFRAWHARFAFCRFATEMHMILHDLFRVNWTMPISSGRAAIELSNHTSVA